MSEGSKRVFRSLKGHDGGASTGSASSGMKAGWEGKEVTTPYPVSLPFEDKRLLAQVSPSFVRRGTSPPEAPLLAVALSPRPPPP